MEKEANVALHNEFFEGKVYKYFPKKKFTQISKVIYGRNANILSSFFEGKAIILKVVTISNKESRIRQDFANVVEEPYEKPIDNRNALSKFLWKPKPPLSPREDMLSMEPFNFMPCPKVLSYDQVHNEIKFLQTFDECEKQDFMIKFHGYFYCEASLYERFLIFDKYVGSLRFFADSTEKLRMTNKDGVRVYPLPINVVYHLITPIIDAVAFIHTKGWLHKDITDHNIMLGFDGKPKLGDFGLSIQCDLSKGPIKWSKEYFVGHPLYVAPELARKEDFDEKVDVWGLAMTMCSLVFGKKPSASGLDAKDNFFINIFTVMYDHNNLNAKRDNFKFDGQSVFLLALDFNKSNFAPHEQRDWQGFVKFLTPFIFVDQTKRSSMKDFQHSEVLSDYRKNWSTFLEKGYKSQEMIEIKGLLKPSSEKLI